MGSSGKCHSLYRSIAAAALALGSLPLCLQAASLACFQNLLRNLLTQDGEMLDSQVGVPVATLHECLAMQSLGGQSTTGRKAMEGPQTMMDAGYLGQPLLCRQGCWGLKIVREGNRHPLGVLNPRA